MQKSIHYKMVKHWWIMHSSHQQEGYIDTVWGCLHNSAAENVINEAGSAGIKKEQLTVSSVRLRVQNSARTQVLSTEAEQRESYFPTLHLLYKQSSAITHFHSLPPFKTNTTCRHTCSNAPNFLQLRSKEPQHPRGISASNIVGNAIKSG